MTRLLMALFSTELRQRRFFAILLVNHDCLKKKILSFFIVRRKLFQMDIALVNDVNLVVMRYLIPSGSLISKAILRKIMPIRSIYKLLRTIAMGVHIIYIERLSGLRRLRLLRISKIFGLILQNSSYFIPINPLKLSGNCPAFQIPPIFQRLLKDILVCRQSNFETNKNKKIKLERMIRI